MTVTLSTKRSLEHHNVQVQSEEYMSLQFKHNIHLIVQHGFNLGGGRNLASKVTHHLYSNLDLPLNPFFSLT
jgi:hypothetical protein